MGTFFYGALPAAENHFPAFVMLVHQMEALEHKDDEILSEQQKAKMRQQALRLAAEHAKKQMFIARKPKEFRVGKHSKWQKHKYGQHGRE